MMKSFDTELFISEIKKRPTIWNTNSDFHANPQKRRKKWNELIDLFGGDNLSPSERHILGHTLRKKWKSLRVCFARELKRQSNYGAGLGRKTEYIYYRQLLFLKNSMKIKAKETFEDKPEYVYYDPVDTDLDETTIEVKNQCIQIDEESNDNPCDDEDYLFLLSLHKTLRRIPKNKKTLVKIKMISLLDEAASENDNIIE